MTLRETLNLRTSGLFVIGWFAVTILGYGFVGLMFHFPSGFPPNNGAQGNMPGFAFGIFMGALSGLVIGGAQALILRLRFNMVRWWILANIGAFAVIHALGDGLPDVYTFAALQISGVFLASGLWLAVRGMGANAFHWIIGVAAAWAVGLTAGLTIANRSTDSWALAHEIVGVCAGIAVAAATAVLLWRLGRRELQAKQVQPI